VATKRAGRLSLSKPGRGKNQTRPRARLAPSRITSHASRKLTKAMQLEIDRRVKLAVAEKDSTFMIGARAASSQNWRDRYDYKREEILLDALLVWRDNPLARRIVELTTQYVVGDGLVATSKHKDTDAFLKKFWANRLNRMNIRSMELCDELTRSGNLFILLSTDDGGMSYIRAVPACDIDHIEHKKNDVEQPTAFYPKASLEDMDPKPYTAYNEEADAQTAAGHWRPVMLHYAVNRAVGAQWGESDLGPLIRWLVRYDGWLEDRVRLNRFRQAFAWDVSGKYANEAERAKREAVLNLNPPNPGAVLVHDESEKWDVKSAKLESPDAERDGLAIKKMIAAGSANPMHFLAEPEGATRTTAEQSGGPTFRHYEQRQLCFRWAIGDVLDVARLRRAASGGRVSTQAEIEVGASDISGRDNAALAVAAAAIVGNFKELRDRGLIDDAELLRLSYKFAGEIIDVEEMLARGKAAPAPVIPAKPNAGAAPVLSPSKDVKPTSPDVQADVPPNPAKEGLAHASPNGHH
jgi:hypothetical protein